jgi:hypothetical protein
MRYFSVMASVMVTAATIVLTLLLAGSASAATFTVTNTSDSGAGSLRQAFLDSYANNTEDTINFDASVFSIPQTITLTSGEMTVPPDYSNGPFTGLTINGPGAKFLTISGNHQSRIFGIEQNGKLALRGLTLTGGNGTGSGDGFALNGGAILVEPGSPGGDYSLVVSNCVVTGNSAVSGGGIYDTGTTLIENTAILNNTATQNGGGVLSYQMNCVNCTISNNTANEGGGIYVNTFGRVKVTHSTIVFNTANYAGAITSDNYYLYTGSVDVKNSIVTNNTTTTGNIAAGAPGADINNVHFHSLGSNIVTSPCCVNNPGPQDQFNVDPKLETQLRAGSTGVPYYALRADSTAVDRGDNCVLTPTASGGCGAPAVTTDGRGSARPQDGDGNGTAVVDIGAFEISAAELAITPAKPDLSAADDSGVSNTDNITKAQNLHFQLNGLTSGATVNVYRNGILIQSMVAAGSSANFSDINLPPDGSFSYSARQIVGGAESISSASVDVTVDNSRPFSTLYQPSTQADPASFLPIRFVIGFSEPVTGLTGSNISLSGSTANVSAATVTLSTGTVFPSYNISVGGVTSDGKVIATLPENVITDSAGNPNWASSSPDNSVTYDIRAPSVIINQAAGQADPATTTPVNFTVVFSEYVTGFNAGSVSLAGSTANVSSANIIITGSGATYNVAVSHIGSSGTVRASVPANRVQDAVGRLNSASTSTDNTVTFSFRPALFDFDGDGRADVSVFRPAEGNWYLSQSQDGFSTQNFGLNGDILTPGDFDGDGRTDLAIFRPGTGTWWYKGSIDRAFYPVQFGTSGDIPLAEDFNGDGRADFVIFRPSTSSWYRLGSNGEYASINFGTTGDIPLVADMDGDGKADPTVYRPSTGTWWYAGSVNGQFYALQWGTATDIPVPGDYDGDGKTDPAYFRPSSGTWSIAYSGTGYTTYLTTAWGIAGDRPVAADYDGDGKTDIAIYRPSNGMWFAMRSTSGFFSQQFGLTGDKPVPASFIP